MDFLKHLAIEFWRRLRYVFLRFLADRCSENSAALTYMSLFALVPLLTVAYTMASAIPAFQGLEEQMQGFLFEHLIPESGSEIQQYLSDFSQQAKTLTGPGIAFLLVTAVLMLRNVEKAFNLIWRARENRSALSSFLLYWAVLTLAPITIGVALGLGTYLSSFADTLGEQLDVLGARAFALWALPLLLSTAGFSLVYAAVPNCSVPFRHALIGGFIAACAFHLARSLFTSLVVGSSITFIYGAFAAVPLFLLWIYLSWNIVLMGGILVHSLSAYQSAEQASRPRVLKALDVLYLFWQKQKSGSSLREIELLDGRHSVIRGLDSETWGELRDILLDKKVITQNDRGHYLLARDLHSLPFWQLKEWVNHERVLTAQDLTAELDWQHNAHELLSNQRSNQRELLNTSLADLFAR
jgi:membrane protein